MGNSQVNLMMEIDECITSATRRMKQLNRKHTVAFDKLKLSNDKTHEAEMVAILRWEIKTVQTQIRDYTILKSHLQRTMDVNLFTKTMNNITRVVDDMPEPMDFHVEMEKLRVKYLSMNMSTSNDNEAINKETEQVLQEIIEEAKCTLPEAPTMAPVEADETTLELQRRFKELAVD